MTSKHPAEVQKGALAATLCYLFWGLVPLYWRQLAAIDAVELIAHRHVWSLLVLLVLLAWQGGFRIVCDTLRTTRGLLLHGLSAVLLTGNWLVYVYGVNTGHVTECSLGYYLVPLVNVAAGRFVLHETMRPRQWLAIACATVGVALLVVELGSLPWIALLLASSWGGYTLMRKQSALGSLTGLSVETLLLAPVAVAFLLWRAADGRGALGHVDAVTHGILLSSGLVTAFPLLLFAYGAQRIRLSTMGLLQYVSPTVQLLLGVLVYQEVFTTGKLVSFAFIWAGLLLYTLDNFASRRRSDPEQA